MQPTEKKQKKTAVKEQKENNEKTGTPEIETRVLFEIQKSPTEIIRLVKGEYNGSPFFDLRVFFKEETTGTFKATKKGFALKPDMFRKFIEGIRSADVEIN